MTKVLAELVAKRFEDAETCKLEHLKDLQEWFPHLTEDDMMLMKKGDKYSGMCMLWCLFYMDSHQEVFKWVARQLMDNTSMPHDAFLVLEFLRFFCTKHQKELFKSTPEKALEWCKENVSFSDETEEEEEVE